MKNRVIDNTQYITPVVNQLVTVYKYEVQIVLCGMVVNCQGGVRDELPNPMRLPDART